MRGKTLIELTDVNTGKIEKIEDHNMITNAPNLIMSINNVFPGMAGASDFKPLYQTMFGGLYLFDTAVKETDITIPEYAGVTGYGSRDHVPTTGFEQFGTFNSSESSITNTYIKMVFDFSTSQGNGTIASVCLGDATGAKMGIAGIKKGGSKKDANYNYEERKYLGNLSQYLGATGFGIRVVIYDANSGLARLIRTTSTAGANGIVIAEYQTTAKRVKLTEKAGYITKERVVLSSETAYILGYDEATKKAYYCLSSLSAGADMKIVIVDMSHVDIKDITYEEKIIPNKTGYGLDGGAYSCVHKNNWYSAVNTSSSNPRLVRVNLNDYTDTEIISFAEGCVYYDGNYTGFRNLYAYNGMIYILYGGYVYNTEKKEGIMPYISSYNYREFSTDSYLYGTDLPLLIGDNSSNHYVYLHVLRNYLSTINNLSTPVTKTASKTMKITYILEFADEVV